MILHRDGSRLVVDKPCGLSPVQACAWLELHLGIVAQPAADLDEGASGALPLALAASAPAHLTVVTHLLLVDAAAADGLPAEILQADPVAGADARTLFRRLEQRSAGGRGAMLWQAVAAAPKPGQVRQHAAAAGLRILGDTGHGGPAWPRLALHAAEARWPDLAPPQALEPASFTAADPAQLALCAALERRGAWPGQVAEAWRCVHRDEIAGLPAAVDVYGPWLAAAWFDEDSEPEAAAAALRPVLDDLAGRLGCRGAVLRLHRRNPHRRGLVTETRLVGEPPPDAFVVTEHGLRYEVNLTRTQHAGLFLDQRDTRRRVALLAPGARMANLFAFTCSFAVVAAAAGCEVVFSVDTAKACLETGMTNFALNGLTQSGRGKFIRQDVRRWLDRQERRRQERPAEHRPLDLVVCDPPVFAAAGDGGAFAVQEQWPLLATAVAGLLAPDGTAVFANNHRGGDHARYRAQLEACFGSVQELPSPLDFPALPGRDPHVRTFACRGPVR
ncbi:MAG: class I SAM-dependent methyltransferase [Candidatus Krumholzibacteriia bacterium]